MTFVPIILPWYMVQVIRVFTVMIKILKLFVLVETLLTKNGLHFGKTFCLRTKFTLTYKND